MLLFIFDCWPANFVVFWQLLFNTWMGLKQGWWYYRIQFKWCKYSIKLQCISNGKCWSYQTSTNRPEPKAVLSYICPWGPTNSDTHVEVVEMRTGYFKNIKYMSLINNWHNVTLSAASVMNCFAESSHIAGMVRTKLMSSKFIPFTLLSINAFMWFFRNSIDMETTVMASIGLPLMSSMTVSRDKHYKSECLIIKP